MDVDDLTRVLGLRAGEAPGDLAEALLLLRRGQPSLVPTMYSAWQQAGLTLSPAMAAELESARARVAFYRELSAAISAAVPEVLPVKGLEVADRYPAGWIRHQNDLDFFAPDEAAVWRAAAAVREHGFEVDCATFALWDGRLHVMCSLRRQHDDPFSLPYGVEVSTYAALGDLTSVPALVDAPEEWSDPLVKNLTMLLYERFEQPYRARDLIDAALLLDAAKEPGRSNWATVVDRLGLWPEYAELAELLADSKIGPRLHPAPLQGRAVARARRTARRAAGAATARGQARRLQSKLVYGPMSRPERRIWAVAEDRLAPAWALRAGMQCFGLLMEDAEVSTARAEVGERDGAAWVDTPVGRFVLAPGDVIHEAALDKLPPAPARATAAPQPAGRPA